METTHSWILHRWKGMLQQLAEGLEDYKGYDTFCWYASQLRKIMRTFQEKDRKLSTIFSKWEYFVKIGELIADFDKSILMLRKLGKNVCLFSWFSHDFCQCRSEKKQLCTIRWKHNIRGISYDICLNSWMHDIQRPYNKYVLFIIIRFLRVIPCHYAILLRWYLLPQCNVPGH